MMTPFTLPRWLSATLVTVAVLSLSAPVQAADKPAAGRPAPPLVRSAGSGPWSAAATWEGGKLPPAGARVQIREGHTVVYDLKSDKAIRFLHIAGTLTFAHDRDTRL